MDGLTISNADAMVERGSTLSELRQAKLSVPTPSVGGTEQKSFAATLKDAVNSVNTAQLESDKKMQELSVGKTKDIADVMLTTEKAEISLKLLTSVRNKIIEAYQEIMKMQV